MTIGKICERSVDLSHVDETVLAAARRMRQRNVGTLVVLDAEKRPVGILTDRDLAMRVLAADASAEAILVGEVMTEDPVTVTEDTAIESALALMRAKGIRRVLVVDAEQHLQGMVSIDDVLLLLAEEFGELGRLLERSSPHRLTPAS